MKRLKQTKFKIIIKANANATMKRIKKNDNNKNNKFKKNKNDEK